jgi:hypothetical protein
VSRSLGIVAVGAVCLGALGAAITLPALVLGGSDAPPAGLALAGSGTHIVVQAAPLPTPQQARPRETGFAPPFVPSLVPAGSAVPIAAPASHPPLAATPVSIHRPKDRRAVPSTKPVKPQPAEPEQTLSALSEKNKHAKPKKARKVHVDHPETGHQDQPKGNKEHTKSAPKPKHEHGPKTKHEGGSKPKHEGGSKPKHDGGPKAKDQGGKPPKDNEDKPPKSDGDKGSEGKAPKH